MSPRTREAKKQAKARPRRRLTAQERLARERRQAQQAAQTLEGLGVASPQSWWLRSKGACSSAPLQPWLRGTRRV